MKRIALLALTALVWTAAGCGPSEQRQEADREEFRTVLQAYLPRLAAAYASREAEGFEGLAAAKEVARIRKRLDELTATGRVLEPDFREVTIERVDIWSYANAYVSTREVWDLRLYSIGGHELLSEEIGQSSRVKYQFKRVEGRWIVLHREKVD